MIFFLNLFWMFHTELIAYKLFTPLNLSLIEESVSLRCHPFRLREARGPVEEAVLCTSEEGCRGLWLPEDQANHESCICEEFPGASLTPVYKLPFLQIKSIAMAPVRGKEGEGITKFDTDMTFLYCICGFSPNAACKISWSVSIF